MTERKAKDGDKFLSNLKLKDSKELDFDITAIANTCIDGLVVKNGACFLTAPAHTPKIRNERWN